MRPHVCRNGGALGEATLAHRAAERLLARVCSKMRGQIRRLGEGLTAGAALVRLLAGMCPEVRFESAGPGVRFPANATEIRLDETSVERRRC